MELHVKLLPKELFWFSVRHYFTSLSGALGMGCILIALGVLGTSWGRLDPSTRLPLLLTIVLMVVIQFQLMYRKAYKQTTDPATSKEICFKFDFNGFKVQQGRDKAQLHWGQIVKIGRVPGVYVIYLTKERAYLIPDRVLYGEKEEQFLKLLEQYVPNKMVFRQKKGK